MYKKKTAYSQMKIETLIISLSPTRSNDTASFKDIRLLTEVRGKGKGARRGDISRKITVIPQRGDWICWGNPSIPHRQKLTKNLPLRGERKHNLSPLPFNLYPSLNQGLWN